MVNIIQKSTGTYSTNNYTEAIIMEQRKHIESKDEKPYKESICVFKALVMKIIKNCKCFLDYIGQSYLKNPSYLKKGIFNFLLIYSL